VRIKILQDFQVYYQEGGSDQVISLPKGVSYTNAVFKRGISGEELYNWYKKTVTSIYNKWSMSELNASSSTVLVETLEISFRGLRKHE